MKKGDKLLGLNHTFVKIPSGGEVIILDKGSVIDAEAEAMLQALHSRSTGGFRNHLEILEEKGAKDFMKNFYVGYGHASIGDCGSTTIFVEGVSMLTAKAIQDTMLYSGQEASTRYVDFSQQPFIDPTSTREGQEILEIQRAFYMEVQEPTKRYLRKLHPCQKGEGEGKYEKAITARAFDITRSFLPAGASTNLAWHTNLRQAADRVLWLRHHPLREVRNIARGLEEALKQHHSNSFNHKRYESTEEYQNLISGNYYYHDKESPIEPVVDFSKIDRDELVNYRTLFENRPIKTELPKFLAQIGQLGVRFTLDFGSFRDIQRHRAIVQRMPFLTTDLGFNNWYLENLPPEMKDKSIEHLKEVNRLLRHIFLSPSEEQYFLPMGYNVSNKFVGDLPAVVYLVELRDSLSVHPTLQRVAHSIGKQIKEGLNIPLYLCEEQGRFDVKRGGEDIVFKG